MSTQYTRLQIYTYLEKCNSYRRNTPTNESLPYRVGGLRSSARVPIWGHPRCRANEKGLPKLWCKLPCQGLCGTGGAASWMVPPGYGAPSRSIYSQAPGNRSSAWVKLHNCGTSGTKMDTMDTLCSKRWRKERQVTWRKSWLRLNYKKQVNPARYSGAARCRHKKQVQKEAGEKGCTSKYPAKLMLLRDVSLALSGMCTCRLGYPACKVHVPYFLVISGLYGSTIFFHIISEMVQFLGKSYWT